MAQNFSFRACQFQLLSHCQTSTSPIAATRLLRITTIKSLLANHFPTFAEVQSACFTRDYSKSFANFSYQDKIGFVIYESDFYSLRTNLYARSLKTLKAIAA